MQHRASFGFVFAIVLIDMLGFGIVIPVLPGLIMELGRISVVQAAVYAGWLGAGYATMQFVFAPIIGNLSDRFGRRPVMLAAILAMALDYSIQGFAPSLGWLVVGRLAAGMAGASYSAAYAWIADVTPPEKRATSFGMLGMAFGFGFIFGPALGGLLAPWGLRMPFHVAAGLAFANFLFGLVFMRESLIPDKRRPFEMARANAFAALKVLRGQNRKVLWSIAALGTWQLAHVVYPAIWAYFAMEAYGFDPRQVGFALGVLGVASALVQGFLLRLALPRLGERGTVMLGVAAVCLSCVVYATANSTAGVYLAISIGALQGLIQPAIAARNSQLIDATSQGELQGAQQSIGSIAQIAGPPLYAGVFAAFSDPHALVHMPAMPLVVSACIAIVALALFLTGSRTSPVTAPTVP